MTVNIQNGNQNASANPTYNNPNPKTQLQKRTTVSKTHFHNKTGLNALTNNCLSERFRGSNKKVREMHNFHTMTSVVREISFAIYYPHRSIQGR